MPRARILSSFSRRFWAIRSSLDVIFILLLCNVAKKTESFGLPAIVVIYWLLYVVFAL
ncbi:hypothetical protein ES703_51442 [subsurface metagenome]